VNKTGNAMHKKPFLLLVATGEHINSRLGIVIGRRIGGAVLRNKIKRYIRHAFNELMQESAEVRLDMILIIKKHYHQFDKVMIKENLQDLVFKINPKSPC
jgi:ribonuclease P protein component